ncbi:methyltransferase domain-containing protein [Limibaculum sp. M0105]|uniref:Methyltransferase domain-containing protein n=1 Tax=Thermohalobaculum xanthum TaxID=2753746 RepID=A0A8J7M585_9RHOB|nr:methyltransferase domain-containing protein [Thermohalobaculum xanthum]MBK0397987.1 methyltransferase domain-containing protein [Thermohalobaculum xanthum]
MNSGGSDTAREPGREDAWSAGDYARNARFVSDLGAPVVQLLDPRPGEEILDLGCGDGVLSQRLAEAGARVVGVDASPDMVAAAQARGVDARLADAHALPFDAAFDAVFSNAAMHWMTRPDAVIAGVARALRPGGRFVAEFGGAGNVAAIRTAIIAVLSRDYGIDTTLDQIWYFPTDAEHRARLEAGGFAVEEIALIPRPTPVTAGIEAWLATLAAPALRLLPEAERTEAAARIGALLAPALRDQAGNWRADYVRLRFRARLR